MPYFEANLDSFISLSKLSLTPLSNPVSLLSYIETIGVPGVSFTFEEGTNSIFDLPTFRSVTNSRINIRVKPAIDLITNVISLNPDMLTIIDISREDNTVDTSNKEVKLAVESALEHENINVAIRIKPELKRLKEAYQLGVDEIEIATNNLADKDTYKEFQELLGHIAYTIRIAKKNDLRISVGGKLDYRIIKSLNEVSDVEFISVGKALLSQSLVIGFQNALREFMAIVEKT
jgi:pyridoxine 5-phosphate synthase